MMDNGCPTVLIVDDDPVARLLAREALEQSGWSVEEAENGPATESCAEMEEEAAEIKPLGKVCKPVKTRPEIDAPPVMDKLVAIIVPVAKSPPTVEVPETKLFP